jgi:WD40 repeat protein
MSGAGSGPYSKVLKVHHDDIHGISVISGSVTGRGAQIISGSKDGAVKKFDARGKWKANLSRHPGSTDEAYSYTNWVTALDTFPDGSSFVAGHRNNYFLAQGIDAGARFFSEKISNLPEMLEVSPPSRAGGAGLGHRGGFRGVERSPFRGEFYKKRNETRVTGVKCLPNGGEDRRVLIGLPEQFIELDCTPGTVVKKYKFDQPEWVYGFAFISPILMVAIHGCGLSLFQDMEDIWDKKELLVREDKKLEEAGDFLKTSSASGVGGAGAAVSSLDEPSLRTSSVSEKGEDFIEVRARSSKVLKKYPPSGHASELKQRPYISSVLSCLSSGHLALSFFGGLNQIFDVETKRPIHQGFEHRDRVWQAVPIPDSDSEYVTCADDKTIKLWDVRAGTHSMRTYEGHPGRVSALAFLDATRFVAGTCPENPWADPDKGQFWFYDLRGAF